MKMMKNIFTAFSITNVHYVFFLNLQFFIYLAHKNPDPRFKYFCCIFQVYAWNLFT